MECHNHCSPIQTCLSRNMFIIFPPPRITGSPQVAAIDFFPHTATPRSPRRSLVLSAAIGGSRWVVPKETLEGWFISGDFFLPLLLSGLCSWSMWGISTSLLDNHYKDGMSGSNVQNIALNITHVILDIHLAHPSVCLGIKKHPKNPYNMGPSWPIKGLGSQFSTTTRRSNQNQLRFSACATFV